MQSVSRLRWAFKAFGAIILAIQIISVNSNPANM